MKTVCLYFQVHQPWRLKKYRFFNMGKDHNYLDDLMNRSIMQKVARQCYLPMNALLLKLIRENKGKFRCSFSITGIAIEQFRALRPRSARHRSRSLPRRAAWSSSPRPTPTRWHRWHRRSDFTEQVKLHTSLIKKEFGVKPTAFRNTELIYSDEIGASGRRHGLPHDAGRRSQARTGGGNRPTTSMPTPSTRNCACCCATTNSRTTSLSASRTRAGTQWPLTADKYVQWLASDRDCRARSSTCSWTTRPSASIRTPTRASSNSCARCRRRSSPGRTAWSSPR